MISYIRKKTMTEAEIIRQAYKRDGIKGDKAISRETGINYDRLHKRRLAPGWFENMTIGELRTLMRRAYFTDQEIIQITKGVYE